MHRSMVVIVPMGCRRHKAPTDPNAWTIVDEKLYLNYSLEVKENWKKDQQQRIVKANKNWPQIKNKE